MAKKAVAQIQAIKPVFHPQGMQVVGETKKNFVKVFETDTHSLADLLEWCEENQVESVGITFESVDSDPAPQSTENTH